MSDQPSELYDTDLYSHLNGPGEFTFVTEDAARVHNNTMEGRQDGSDR